MLRILISYFESESKTDHHGAASEYLAFRLMDLTWSIMCSGRCSNILRKPFAAAVLFLMPVPWLASDHRFGCFWLFFSFEFGIWDMWQSSCWLPKRKKGNGFCVSDALGDWFGWGRRKRNEKCWCVVIYGAFGATVGWWSRSRKDHLLKWDEK